MLHIQALIRSAKDVLPPQCYYFLRTVLFACALSLLRGSQRRARYVDCLQLRRLSVDGCPCEEYLRSLHVEGVPLQNRLGLTTRVRQMELRIPQLRLTLFLQDLAFLETLIHSPTPIYIYDSIHHTVCTIRILNRIESY